MVWTGRTGAALACGLMIGVCGCASNSGSSGLGAVEQLSFASPEDAVAALTYAAVSRDREYGLSLFGPEVDELGSGDPEVDRYESESFAEAIQRRHDLRRNDDGSVDIVIGEGGVAFPVPLVERNGRWLFDTLAGVERLEDMRIGYHELMTIEALRAIAMSQAEYQWEDRDGDGVQEFAARFESTPGQRDGLYWVTADNEPNSPLGEHFADSQSPRSKTRGYNGYFYAMLSGQGPGAPGGARSFVDASGNMTGGFAVLAYPAVYDETGVMSFIVGPDGVVYERDLGAAATKRAGQTITVFDPTGWSVSED